MTRRRGKPRLGKTGCLFWLFIFLVIIVIILYRGKGSFKETFSHLRNRLTTDEVQETEESADRAPEISIDPDSENEPIVEEQEGDIAESPEVLDIPAESSQGAERESVEQVEFTGSTVEKKPDGIPLKEIRAPLYFVKIEADGSAQLQPVVRSVQFKDSPITRTIESLLKGPSKEEASRGLISFIPQGTDLLSAQLNNGVLTLNFSGSFEQNYYGREAILFQLSQIMLTSFEFSRVSGLTILIDGQKKQYITGEGIPLKEVYTKDDLSTLSTRS